MMLSFNDRENKTGSCPTRAICAPREQHLIHVQIHGNVHRIDFESQTITENMQQPGLLLQHKIFFVEMKTKAKYNLLNSL